MIIEWYALPISATLTGALTASLGGGEVARALGVILSVHGLFAINSIAHPGSQPLPRKVDVEDRDAARGDDPPPEDGGEGRERRRAAHDKWAGAGCESHDLWWLGIFNAGEGTRRPLRRRLRWRGPSDLTDALLWTPPTRRTTDAAPATGFHGAHHETPWCAHHGRRKWYNFDLTYGVILLLERLGLIWNVQHPGRPDTRRKYAGGAAAIGGPVVCEEAHADLGRDVCRSSAAR